MTTWIRRLLGLASGVALGSCLVAVAFAWVTGALIIRGASMEPAIPRGALVTVESVRAEALTPGLIITVRADNGVLVTHRVRRVVATDEGVAVELRGDANAVPDPVLVPAAAVVGRVDLVVPVAGYLVAMLGMPVGLLAVTCLLGAAALATLALRTNAAPTPNGAQA